jgi:hypothetical protein
MEKRHTIFIVVVLGVLALGLAGYGACMMDTSETTGVDLGEVPGLPDASMPEMPPEVDDPPVNPDELGNGMPSGEPAIVPGDPIVPDLPPGEVNVDLPDEATDNLPALDGRTVCGATTCAADERCCVHEGQCYPRTCTDCCSGEDDQPRPDETVLNPPVIDPVAR